MTPLKIAILHYHLRPAGVTRVVERAVRALGEAGIRTLVLTGEKPARPLPENAEIAVIPELGYDAAPDDARIESLIEEMEEVSRRRLGASPDVWHVHNHALGKNLTVPILVGRLAQSGRAVLLQIHDFAEDGRPENFRTLAEGLEARGLDLDQALYPARTNCRYATLNTRDAEFLRRAGAAPENVHVLPNPVDNLRRLEPPESGARFTLYPTTGIRRKNIGEFLLTAALDDTGGSYGISRTPSNPKEQGRYAQWRRFADDLRLPVVFDCGADAPSFEDVVRPAAACCTTSVAEGFGMAFLEPWLMGRPLVGRDLPEITRDFKDRGVRLPGLYEALPVSADWIDRRALCTRLRERYAAARDAYGRETGAADFERLDAAVFDDDAVDFGRLDEEFQRDVIRRVRNDADVSRTMRERLPAAPEAGADVLKANARIVSEEFCEEDYGRRLSEIYRGVAEAPNEECDPIRPAALIERFLSPRRFTLLRA